MAEPNSQMQCNREIDSDLNDLLQHLEIREDEEEGIVLEENLEVLKEQARWTALAKVNSPKTFSHAAFIANMKYAWSLAKEVNFKAIEENLFLLQFSCLGDWRKVMDEGPWIFRGYAVLLEEYDGITKPSKVKFKNMVAWVRIYDLPTGFRTKNIGRQLGNKIGEFLKVDLDEDINGWMDFLRIKVKLDVEKPLTRIVYISLGAGKREAFRVKYERLPKFCAVCGIMGHSDTECGDGVHDKKTFQYGDWLIVPDRKAIIKGSKSSGSSDTKGLISKDSAKDFPLLRNSEQMKESSSQNISHVLNDDARSTLKRDSDRLLKSDGIEAQDGLVQGCDGKQESNNLALAPIPNSDLLKVSISKHFSDVGCPLTTMDVHNESEYDRILNQRDQKRLRVEVVEYEVNDIEMRSAGSLEECRREQ